ncbi:MAG: biopolymer transporter ExbD [Proteobacteria bacterium]|nr:biopolymer transporter ExbD [Pseudomonadota bacterium]
MLKPGQKNFGGFVGRKTTSSRERRPESTVPMINIVFLLLLYFMIAGKLHIDLEVTPPTSAASTPPSGNLLNIAITNTGAVQYRGDEIAIPQIELELQSDFKDQVVQISADGQADAVLVAQAVASLSKVGVKQITLLTLKR